MSRWQTKAAVCSMVIIIVFRGADAAQADGLQLLASLRAIAVLTLRGPHELLAIGVAGGTDQRELR
ncbi:MAG: hypothetical protein M3406_09095 [Chloroflexota bacterium]|nr:hypothetical protein [Chloroflexota bacterium]